MPHFTEFSFIWVSNWSSNQVCCKCLFQRATPQTIHTLLYAYARVKKVFGIPTAFHPAKLIRLCCNSHPSVGSVCRDGFCLPSPPCNPAEYGGHPETRVEVLTWKSSYRWADAPMRDRRKTAEPDLKMTTNLVWWENGCESHPSREHRALKATLCSTTERALFINVHLLISQSWHRSSLELLSAQTRH